MIIEGATMTVNQVKFSIVKVKPSVLKSPDIELTRQSFQMVFGKVPIILSAPDTRGKYTVSGAQRLFYFFSSLSSRQNPLGPVFCCLMRRILS